MWYIGSMLMQRYYTVFDAEPPANKSLPHLSNTVMFAPSNPKNMVGYTSYVGPIPDDTPVIPEPAPEPKVVPWFEKPMFIILMIIGIAVLILLLPCIRACKAGKEKLSESSHRKDYKEKAMQHNKRNASLIKQMRDENPQPPTDSDEDNSLYYAKWNNYEAEYNGGESRLHMEPKTMDGPEVEVYNPDEN